jgi:hypothetical protein
MDIVESASLLPWKIQPDGAGTLYAERGTDFSLECVWGACGLVSGNDWMDTKKNRAQR